MAENELKWWQKAPVYQVYPKSFNDTAGQGTGTIRGVTEKLDYIASLGVRAIWLTPVYASPMKDNGYDVADYYAIDPSFGTMDDMDELIAQARERDIRIVMDLVMNHTSNECAWFKESASSRDNDKADWYIWRDPNPDGSAPNNWRSFFSGSVWSWCEERQQYYMHTFGDFQPDLNWECEDMRRELYAMVNFWLKKGVGGFRIDAIPYIKKPAVLASGKPDSADGTVGVHDMTANTEGILDFLYEFKAQTVAGTDAFTVAEANGVPPEELDLWVGENGAFDMIFQFDHVKVPLDGTETWYRGCDWKLTQLKRPLVANEDATADSWCATFFENHDQPRSVNKYTPKAKDKSAAAKMLATVLLTMRGTPFIYQGEELGYQNVAWSSPDNYDDVYTWSQYNLAIENGCTPEEAMAGVHDNSRDNARTPMQWSADENAGFTTGAPWLPVHDDYMADNVAVQEADPASVLNWYRELARVRAELPVLASGDFSELEQANEQVFAYARHADGQRVVVLANFDEVPAAYDASLIESASLVVSTHGDAPEPGTLRPLEAAVYTV